MKTLIGAVDDYELSKEITSEYAYQLRYATRRLSRFLGRDATVDDLRKKTINRWLKHEREAGGLSDRSRSNIRVSILTLWRKFGKRRLDREEIRSVEVTPKNPEAWSYEELQQVIAGAGRLPGYLTNGIPRAKYFATCLWFAYETGLRRRDVWRFDLTLFDRDRLAAMTQHKTRRVHLVTITRETELDLRSIYHSLLAANDPHARTPLRWPQATSQFYYWMRQARALSGIDASLPNRALQHIRRTGATEVERQGGLAWRFLGHVAEGLDRKAYVDARKTVKATTPMRNRSAMDDRQTA